MTRRRRPLPARITSLDQLDPRAPTAIGPDTEVVVPGCYLDPDGRSGRWTLRSLATDARVRDLVVRS